MTSRDHRRRLQEAALEVRAQRILTRAETTTQDSTFPHLGDVYTLAATAAHGVLWATLDSLPCNGQQQWILVAADLHPSVGSADVAVPPLATCGALTLRCGVYVTLEAEDLAEAHRAGTLPPGALHTARQKFTQLQREIPVGSILERDMDGDPEYQDWLQEGPAAARLAVLQNRQYLSVPKPTADVTETICADGIDATRGTYLTPPAGPPQVLAWAKQETVDPGVLHLLRHVHHAATHAHLGNGPAADDPRQQGWAVVWHASERPEVKRALAPLIEHRRGQLGEGNIKLLDYRPGEDWRSWLSRHGVAPGHVETNKVPYYLLLAGSPTAIPFAFQQMLSIEYAVGRLSSDRPDDLQHYAQGLVRRESQQDLVQERQAVYFAPQPLPENETLSLAIDSAQLSGWHVHRLLGHKATKTQLVEALQGMQGRSADLLWISTHGLAWPATHAQQKVLQGSLLCHGWPGEGAVRQEFCFSGGDLTPETHVAGTIAFLRGSYSVGATDSLLPGMDSEDASRSPPQPFITDLPRRLLSHPQGSAAAVIGFVGRDWKTAADSTPQDAPFVPLLQHLADGQPVGRALHQIKIHYAALATQLAAQMKKIRLGARGNEAELAKLWADRNNARNLIILGDPLASIHLKMSDDR